MKSLFQLFAFIFLVSPAFSQENYVEVIVEETVELKPVAYTYEIRIGRPIDDLFEGLYNDDDEYSDPDDLRLDEITVSEVTAILDKNKFTYTLSSDEDYSITEKEKKENIYVNLSSLDELKRLRSVLKDVDGIYGDIKDVEYETIESHHKEVFDKLYKKAVEQAELLILGTNKKIGDVIRIEQISGSENPDDFWSSYTNRLSAAFGQLTNESVMTRKKTVKYSYRFALLD